MAKVSKRRPGTSDRTRRRHTPPDQRRPRGRPPKQVTDEQRAEVKMLIGSGMTTDEVAMVIGCNAATLNKHFAPEIMHARVLMKAEALRLLWKHARAGSSPLIRRVTELTTIPQNREEFLRGGLSVPKEEKKAPEPKLGKKEAQAIAAANPDAKDPLGRLMAERAAAGKPN